MLAVNAIAALIMMAALIPTAKLIRKGISGLVNAVGGGDPSDEGTNGAARNAMMVASMGLRGGRSGGKGRGAGKTDSAPDRGGGSGMASSSSGDKGQGGHLPEKRVPGTNGGGASTQFRGAGNRTPSSGSAEAAEAKEHSGPESSEANGFSAQSHHTNKGNNHHMGASAGSRAGQGSHNVSGNQTRSVRHQKPKQSLGTKTKKWASNGAKIGNAVSKVPSTAVGMAASVPFGWAAGATVAKGGNLLGRGAGGAIGGASALAARGGGKAVRSSQNGMNKARDKFQSSVSGATQKSGVSSEFNRTMAQNPSMQRQVQRGMQGGGSQMQRSTQGSAKGGGSNTVGRTRQRGNSPSSKQTAKRNMKSVKNVDASRPKNNRSHIKRPGRQ